MLRHNQLGSTQMVDNKAKALKVAQLELEKSKKIQKWVLINPKDLVVLELSDWRWRSLSQVVTSGQEVSNNTDTDTDTVLILILYYISRSV